MPLAYEELTAKIIAGAIEVHRRLGPGFLESIYEKALAIDLRKRGLRVETQVKITILYDGEVVGIHRLDMVIEETIVVEMKAIKNLEDIHFAIAHSYLRAAGKQHGLILNFAKMPLEIKRIIAT